MTPWWNKKFSALRAKTRKLFNTAQQTKTVKGRLKILFTVHLPDSKLIDDSYADSVSRTWAYANT
jgi:hypothetical protein